MEFESDALEIGINFNEFDGELQDGKKCCENIKMDEQHLTMDVDESDSLQRPENDKLEIEQDGKSKENDLHGNYSSRKSRRSKDRHNNNDPDERHSYCDNKTSKNKLFKVLHASPDLDPSILGREIAYRLGEMKVCLIANVVKVLGFGTAMDILEETKRIERRGGMSTVDKKRRRTPGGVYIYCLKEKGFASKEQVNEIFKEEKERFKEILKRKKKQKNEKQRKELADLKPLKDRVALIIAKNIEEDYMNLEKNKEQNIETVTIEQNETACNQSSSTTET